ncbi:hypothetical protein AB6A40_007230 [Gnathostoma spinigerum]|uniref:Sushi domain-containing protein n=1 Tax=Gnathostoma spinigerum TaxID=75299 RepID=A0ABD6EMM0_9BILA
MWCPLFHVFKGKVMATCQSDGKWNVELGHFVPEPDSCAKLDNPAVIYSSSPTRPRTIARIERCPVHYVFEGKHEITCQKNGNWSENLGHCVPSPDTCTKFDISGVTYSEMPIRPMTVAWLEMCPVYQMLEGNEEATCQEDGMWSVQLGKCVPTPDTCARFDIPEVTYSETPIRPTTVAEIAKCPGHHCLHGNTMVVCQANGTWSGSIGRCEEDLIVT